MGEDSIGRRRGTPSRPVRALSRAAHHPFGGGLEGAPVGLRGGRPPLPTGRVVRSSATATPTSLDLHRLNRHD
eukprot:7219297-Alexandrium_andersonii.AAC.1